MKIEPGDHLGVHGRNRPIGRRVCTSFTVQTNTIELHSALTPSPEVCAMLRNYLKYFVMTPLLLIFGEIHPRAFFSGVPNSPTPKLYKHSEIRNFSGTVQGLRLVKVRNDQPFDLPCPYGE